MSILQAHDASVFEFGGNLLRHTVYNLCDVVIQDTYFVLFFAVTVQVY